ncbi:hypothetical protein KAI87_09235 [Myxococcota bacterium]|nr:hypothetical protein [Myxococcota bacterium]
MPEHENQSKRISQILDGTELHLMVDQYSLNEILETGTVSISCEVHDARTGEKQVIDGSGVGLVDAFFSGLMDAYSERYPSLSSIQIADFAISANVETARARSRSDMAAAVKLWILNPHGQKREFQHSSPSITRSSIAVVLEAIEFYINSERAVIEVSLALQHAKASKRADSVERYTTQLSRLVEINDYSQVLKKNEE